MIIGLSRVQLLVLICVLGATAAIMNEGVGVSSGSINPQISGTTGFRGKAFTNNFYRPSGAAGTVLHNVNTLNGQAVYTVPLVTIGAGSISYTIGLNYSGAVRQAYAADNEIGPTSWIGYGWNMSVPFVAANHMGTTNNLDDLFYCNLGEYGGGQLLQKGLDQYFVASDPSISVNLQRDADGKIIRWFFLTANGVRLTMGSTAADDGAGRVMNHFAGILAASPYSSIPSSEYTYRWDVSRIEEYGNAIVPSFPSLEFKYEQIRVAVGLAGNGTAKTYTRESYLKEVVRKDTKGNIIEAIKFETTPKVATEYSHRSFAPSVAQELYETRYLSKISKYTEGQTTPDMSWILVSRLQNPDANFMYTKRFLDEVRYEYPNPRGGVLTESKIRWGFTYESDPIRHFALKTVLKPFSGKDEFEYGRPSFESTVWNATQQETGIRKLSTSAGGEIQLPADPGHVLGFWENQTQCSEKFCFVAAVDKSTVYETLSLEVWKNNGSYFELAKRSNNQPFRWGFNSSEPGLPNMENRIKLLPWGDNFIVVDSKDADFWLYEWNGESFTEYSKSMLAGRTLNRGDGEFINIHLGGDFFVVEDGGYSFKDCSSSPTQAGVKYYVVKKVNGVWKELNEGASCDLPAGRSSCNIDFPANYGESNYLASGCLAIRDNSLASAGTGQFHIVHTSSGMIFPFFQNANNDFFAPQGHLIQPFDNSVQKSGYPMNWEGQILGPVQIGNDYFLIKSKVGNTVRIDAMHYTGANIMRIGGPVFAFTSSQFAELAEVTNNLRAWISGDYFVTTSGGLGRTAAIHFKRMYTQGTVPIALGFEPATLFTDLPLESIADIRVATGAYAFSLEIYPNGKAPGGMTSSAPILDASNDYRSYLYQLNPTEMGPVSQLFYPISASSYRDVNGRKLFNFSFAGAENLLTARSCVNASNGNCTGAENDGATFYTARVNPWKDPAGTNVIREVKPVFNPWAGTSYSHHYSKYSISNSGKLGAVCMFNTLSRRIEFSLLQHTGTGFTKYPYQISVNGVAAADLNLVSKFKTYADISGQGGGRWTERVFKYTSLDSPFLTNNPEYNSLSQTFVFPNVSVYTYQGSESMTTPEISGAETVKHIIDAAATPLIERHLVKVGLPTEKRQDDMRFFQGQVVLERNMSKVDYEYYDPQRDSAWPDNLYMSRLKKVTSTLYDRSGSTQTQATTYHKYHPYSNSPLFTKSNISGKWYLTQTLFQNSGINQGLPIGHNRYAFTSEPPTATLDAWSNPSLHYTQDNAFNKALGASRLDYDITFPFLSKKTSVWKDDDATLTADDLKRGKDPVFSLAEGWQDGQIIEKRNELGQILESRMVLDASGGERRTTQLYEGRASLPVATFDNAYYEDVAYLSGENFNVSGLTTHDWDGRWIKADAGATDFISYSGRASIKVVNNSGPQRNLFLKGAQGQGYDYIVSAWIYCASGTTPALKVDRYRSNGAFVDNVTVNAPFGTSLVANRWQRYQIKLTNSALRSGGLFNGSSSGDYLRVSIGTSGSGTLYVDDIICRPSTATYSLQAFDGRQRPIHKQDMNHTLTTLEYDLFGKTTAIRDDKHRIFTSSASHQPGEND